MSDEETPLYLVPSEPDEALPAARETYVGKKSDRTYCGECAHVMNPFYAKCPKCEGERNRRRVDALADVIRELKGSLERPMSTDRERELMKLLVTYDHPDPDGLLRALQEKRDTPRQPTRKERR